MPPCFAKRRLVWEGTQRMYECEEVIDEGVQGGEGAYLFG
jgi:hypothetical protein